MIEKHARQLNILIPQDVLYFLQFILMLTGFFLALKVIHYRGFHLFAAKGQQLLPLLLTFVVIVTLFNLWMMMQSMQMRM